MLKQGPCRELGQEPVCGRPEILELLVTEAVASRDHENGAHRRLGSSFNSIEQPP